MAAAAPAIIAAITVANQVQNVQQSRKQAKEASREAEVKSALLRTEAAAQEEERKKRLRTALSTQKALFGARGIAASSGSALALANKQIEENRNESSLNLEKNRLQLNQISRGGGFNQTRALLNTTSNLLGSLR